MSTVEGGCDVKVEGMQLWNRERDRGVLRLAVSVAAVLVTAQGARGQVTIGAQTQVDLGRGPGACNETTIAVSRANPLELVAGWNDYREGTARTGVGLSLDGGLTWSDFLLRPPAPNQGATEGDPMTAADPRTGTIWAGAISFTSNGGVFVARKDPGDTGFQPAIMARVTGGADKGWMAAGPLPGAPSSTRLYVAYNEGLIWSSDMGAMWTTPKSLGAGLGFLPRVGPGGELYVCYWDLADGVKVKRSFDGGATLSGPLHVATRMDTWSLGDTSRFPGVYRVAVLNAMAVDPVDGTLYVVYFDTTDVSGGNSNVDLYLCKSTDLGTSWSAPVVINGDSAPPGDQFFPWLEMDETGRLQLLFYDTRGIAQNDSAPVGLIHAYYAYSDDQGATWSETQLTPQPMDSGLAFSGGIFIGDYQGLATAGGRTFPLYMATPNGDADVFTHVIEREAIATYCPGVGCPCGNDDAAAGCGNHGADGSPASGARLVASGSASVSADDLVLTLEGVQPLQFGIIYTGPGQASLPFGDGLRCIAAPFFRYPQRQADASGAIVYGPGEIVSWAAAHFGPGGQVLPGAAWNYQGWYRDPLGPCASSFNLSNGVAVIWQ